MVEHFSLWSYAGWLLNAGLEAAIVCLWLKRRSLPQLTFLPILAGFLLASDIICFFALKGAPYTFAYWYCYWYSQLIETILRAFLAIQILSHVLSEYKLKVLLWSVYAASCIVIVFMLGLPTDMTRVMLRMAIVTDLLAGIVVAMAIMFPSLGWPRGFNAAAFGLLFSLCSDMAIFLVRFNTGNKYIGMIRAALPICGVISLLLFYAAVMVGKQRVKQV